MADPQWERVTTLDGRGLEVVVEGPLDRPLLLFHTGTPMGTVAGSVYADVAERAGLTYVSYSRPGYGTSDPALGRSVADCVADVDLILRHLGADTFRTIGWSGGGPHALACAALHPGCIAAATIAGVAPWPAEGLDWFAGMGPENVEEFELAMQGEAPLTPFIMAAAAGLAGVTGTDVANELGGLIPEVDKASLTGEFAEWMAACFRKSVVQSIRGWLDDDLAFTKPWGFDLAAIKKPVSVWQGDQDLMVPFGHGQWVAEATPTANPHLLADHGHLSIGVGLAEKIVADLVAVG